MEQAVFGGGCFWCLDAVFGDVPGVVEVVSGYAAGATPSPSYREVCSGRTGHAEVVQVSYDPEQTSYTDLLEIFFGIHDPTTKDRQGADVGSQYRSIIVAADAQQEREAQAAIARVQERWDDPVVTEVVRDARFWPAEAEHQDYFRRNPDQGYCRLVIAPKVAKAQQHGWTTGTAGAGDRRR